MLVFVFYVFLCVLSNFAIMREEERAGCFNCLPDVL